MSEIKENTNTIESMKQGIMNVASPQEAPEIPESMRRGVERAAAPQEPQIPESIRKGIENATAPKEASTPEPVSQDTEKMTTAETKKNMHENIFTQHITRNDHIIEYHIFSTGEIKYRFVDKDGKKITTTDELKNIRNMVKYFYYDASNNQHIITENPIGITKVNNMYATETEKPYPDKIGGDQIYLVDIQNVPHYLKNGLKYAPNINSPSGRYYPNDVSLASIIGAMLNLGYPDIDYRGASSEIGESTGGSESHINGYNIDFGYLRTDQHCGITHLDQNTDTGKGSWKDLDVERQNKFISEFKKFGWKNMLGWEYWNKEKIKSENESKSTAEVWEEENAKQKIVSQKDLPTMIGISHYKDHQHHIHIQWYAPTISEMSE